VVETEDVFITTTMETNALSALKGFPPLPRLASLIGATKLSKKDNLLTLTRF
jgi:hypothetical protein